MSISLTNFELFTKFVKKFDESIIYALSTPHTNACIEYVMYDVWQKKYL